MAAQPQRVSDAPDDPIASLLSAGRHRDAVALCAETHGTAMGRLCMAMLGDQAEAEETVQEALVAAYDSIETFRGEGSIRAWLLGIARRMCSRRLARRTRRELRLQVVHDADADAEMPDDIVERRRKARRVRNALSELKPSDREALLLRYENGLDYDEIAQAYGIDARAARKRVSRALARLRAVIPESFFHGVSS